MDKEINDTLYDIQYLFNAEDAKEEILALFKEVLKDPEGEISVNGLQLRDLIWYSVTGADAEFKERIKQTAIEVVLDRTS